MENNAVYMQVHIKLYSDSELLDEFAIDALDQCYELNTEVVYSHHQVVDFEGEGHDKMFQIKLTVVEEGLDILLHMPIHQSDRWESVRASDKYWIAFYCILNENHGSLRVSNDT